MNILKKSVSILLIFLIVIFSIKIIVYKYSLKKNQTSINHTSSMNHTSINQTPIIGLQSSPIQTITEPVMKDHPQKNNTQPTALENNNPPLTLEKNTHVHYQNFINHTEALFNYVHTNHTKVLFTYVHNLIGHAKINHYQLGSNDFNPTKGVYKLDCSAYIDHVLKTIDTASYHTMAFWSRSSKPTSIDYYRFFNQLPSNKIAHDWYKIQNPLKLQPGDILVFKYKNTKGKAADGHVMVVMGKPTLDPNRPDAVLIKISDDAPVGHSDDTRAKHTSGIGIGDLLLKVNSITKKPIAYAWKINTSWKSDMDFAMGRPVASTEI